MIQPEPAVTNSWERLRERQHLGLHYEWLARLAGQLDVDLELVIHQDDRAAALLKECVARLDLPPTDGIWLLKDHSHGRGLHTFDRFRLPLFGITKLDMLDLAMERRFAPLLEKTWFCHTPTVLWQPCGFCNPCRYTRDEGLGRSVSERLKRHRRRRKRKQKLLALLDAGMAGFGRDRAAS